MKKFGVSRLGRGIFAILTPGRNGRVYRFIISTKAFGQSDRHFHRTLGCIRTQAGKIERRETAPRPVALKPHHRQLGHRR